VYITEKQIWTTELGRGLSQTAREMGGGQAYVRAGAMWQCFKGRDHLISRLQDFKERQGRGLQA
jgi:hypothetical protein